jgi:hypothetical protein
MIWTHMVKWYKSQGSICVCFKRWDKYVCDPYEATPWRNHTLDINYSRSLFNYFFNLSIEIVVLSRGIQKEGWCLPKLKPLYSKAISKNQNPLDTLCMTVVRIEKLRVFLLKSNWTSSAVVEPFQLQLNFTSTVSSCSWDFSTTVELHFNCVFSCSWAFSTTVKLQLWTSLTRGASTVPRAVQLVSVSLTSLRSSLSVRLADKLSMFRVRPHIHGYPLWCYWVGRCY